MKFIAILFLLINSPMLSASRSSEQYFKFTKVSGDIRYWLPLSGKWRTLKAGMSLPVGTLLQLDQGETLEFTRYVNLPKGWQGKQLYIKTKDPVNIRLDDQLLRKINLDEFHMNRLLETDKKIDKRRKQLSNKPIFQDAWDRVSVFFRSQDDERTDFFLRKLNEKSKQDLEVGVRSEKIELLMPEDGHLGMTENLPLELQAIWKKDPKYKGNYLLYFWKANEPKQEAVAKTKSDRHVLLVPEAGSYYLQVISADKSMSSKAHLIHVDQYSNKTIFQMNKEEYAQIVHLKFPPNDFNFFTKKENTKIDFYWEKQKNIEIQKSEIIIKNHKKQTAKREAINLNKSFHKEIQPGTYSWWVEFSFFVTKNGKKKRTKAQTKERIFSIYKTQKMSSIQSALTKVATPSYIYFKDGF